MKARFFLISVLGLAVFSAFGQDLSPPDPDILLPEVILRIEDLSIEQVRAGLPPEEELMPQREIQLPEVERWALETPSLPLELPPATVGAAADHSGALAAEVVLGGGSMYHLLSSVSLFKLGQEPRFTLRFRHETLDGLGGHSPGIGYQLREEVLEGTVRLRPQEGTLEFRGFFEEDERGLQEQSPFASSLFRRAEGEGSLLLPLSDRVELSVKGGSTLSSRLLTGSEAAELLEGTLEPELGLSYKAGGFGAGLAARYRYRSPRGGPDPLHRLMASGSLRYELSEELRLEAEGGWFGSSSLGSLFPFSLGFSATMLQDVQLSASGGYKVVILDAGEILRRFPWSDPGEEIEDARGWFAEGSLRLPLLTDLYLQSRAELFQQKGRPDLDPDLDPSCGLLPLIQEEALELTTSFSLQWNILKALTLRAGLDSLWFPDAETAPRHVLKAEAEAGEEAGLWGARLTFKAGIWGKEAEEDSYTWVPELDAGGFLRLSESVSLALTFSDLLYPLIGGPRYDVYPFEAPGIRGLIEVRIHL